MIAPRVEKSTDSSFRLAPPDELMFCDSCTLATSFSWVEAFQTVGAVIAASMITRATRVSDRPAWLRARMPTCRVIAAPAAIRNHPAYGLVATAIRHPRAISHRYRSSVFFHMLAP